MPTQTVVIETTPDAPADAAAKLAAALDALPRDDLRARETDGSVRVEWIISELKSGIPEQPVWDIVHGVCETHEHDEPPRLYLDWFVRPF